MSGTVVRRLVRVVIVAAATMLAGCKCQTASFEQIFLLDGRGDNPLGFDGSVVTTSADAGDGSDAGATSPLDADVTAAPPGPALDCTPAAVGCTPGGDCQAACNCVLTRDQLQRGGGTSINKCQLLPTSGPPAVEVDYTITFTGCGD